MRQAEHPDLRSVPVERALLALGDPLRLGIVRVLADGAEHVQADFDVSVVASTLSHHMKTLRLAGLVRSRPEGNRCFISLRRTEFDERFPGLLSTILRLVPGQDR